MYILVIRLLVICVKYGMINPEKYAYLKKNVLQIEEINNTLLIRF